MRYLLFGLLVTFISLGSTSYAGTDVSFSGLKTKSTKILDDAPLKFYSHLYETIFKELDEHTLVIEVQIQNSPSGFSQGKISRSDAEYLKNEFFGNCETVHHGTYEFIELPIGKFRACRISIKDKDDKLELRFWRIPGIIIPVKYEYYRNDKLSSFEEAVEILK